MNKIILCTLLFLLSCSKENTVKNKAVQIDPNDSVIVLEALKVNILETGPDITADEILGNLEQGKTMTQELKITNKSSIDRIVSFTTTDPNVSFSPTSCATLARLRGACLVTVTIKAGQNLGQQVSSIQLEGQPINYILNVIPLAPLPLPTISFPNPMNLGTFFETKLSQEYTLINSTAGAITYVIDTSLTNPDFTVSSTTCTTVARNRTCKIKVEYQTLSTVAGPVTSTFMLNGHVVTVAATISVPEKIELNPLVSVWDFGDIQQGNSKTLTISVQNTLAMDLINLTSNTLVNWTKKSISCELSWLRNRYCAITYEFNSTGKPIAEYLETLTIENNKFKTIINLRANVIANSLAVPCTLQNAENYAINISKVLTVQGDIPLCEVKTCEAGYSPSLDKRSCVSDAVACSLQDAQDNQVNISNINLTAVPVILGMVTLGDKTSCLINECANGYTKSSDSKSCIENERDCVGTDVSSLGGDITNAATFSGKVLLGVASACKIETCSGNFEPSVSGLSCEDKTITNTSMTINNKNLNGYTKDNNLSLSISATNALEMKISDTNNCSNGTWEEFNISKSFPIAVGNRNSASNLAMSIQFRRNTQVSSCIHTAGSIALANSHTFKHDNISPIITVSSPLNNANLLELSFNLVGNCSELTLPLVISGDIQVPSSPNCSGAFNLPFNLTAGDGSKLLDLSQTDLAGNLGFLNLTLNKISPIILTGTVDGLGKITSTGTINCPGSCQQIFTSGQSITLTAAPLPGASFSSWGGDCAFAGSNVECPLIINSTTNVSANFVTNQLMAGGEIGPSNDFGDMATQDDKILISGLFDGSEKTVKLNADGSRDYSFASNVIYGRKIKTSANYIYITPNDANSTYSFYMPILIYKYNKSGILVNTFTTGDDQKNGFLLGGGDDFVYSTYNSTLYKINSTTGAAISSLASVGNNNENYVRLLKNGEIISKAGNTISKIIDNGTTFTKTTLVSTPNSEILDIDTLDNGDYIYLYNVFNKLIGKFIKSSSTIDATFVNTNQPAFTSCGLSVAPKITVDNGGNKLSELDDKIYVVGNFCKIGTVDMYRLVRFNYDGTVDTTFYGSQTLKGLNPLNSVTRNHIINAVLTSPVSFANGVDVYGWSAAKTMTAITSDGYFILNDNLKSYGTTGVSGLAKILKNGLLDTEFNSGSTDLVDAAFPLTSTTYLVAGKYMSHWNGKESHKLAVLGTNKDIISQIRANSNYSGMHSTNGDGSYINDAKADGTSTIIAASINASSTYNYNNAVLSPNPIFKILQNGNIDPNFTFRVTPGSNATPIYGQIALLLDYDATTMLAMGSVNMSAGAAGVINGPFRFNKTTGEAVTFNTTLSSSGGFLTYNALRPMDMFLESGTNKLIECCNSSYNGTNVYYESSNAQHYPGVIRLNAAGTAPDLTFPKIIMPFTYNASSFYNKNHKYKYVHMLKTSTGGFYLVGEFANILVGTNVNPTSNTLYNYQGIVRFKNISNVYSIDTAFVPKGLNRCGDPSSPWYDLTFREETKIGTIICLPTDLKTGELASNAYNNMAPIISAAAIDSSDRLIVAGNFSKYGLTSVESLIRINTNGTIDATFSSNVRTALRMESRRGVWISDVKVLGNGKIVVSGQFKQFGTSIVFGNVILNEDGTISSGQ